MSAVGAGSCLYGGYDTARIIFTKCCRAAKKIVTQYNDSIRAFKLKLSLWKTQLSSGDTAHFPCLTSVRATGCNDDMDQYKDKITGLPQQFEQRLQVFSELEKEFALFSLAI